MSAPQRLESRAVTSSANPPLDGARAIALVVAIAGKVSLDDLVSWNVARPTDLWRWLEGARRHGWIAEDGAAGGFVFREGAPPGELVAAARPDEWRWVLGHPALAPCALAAARDAVQARRLETASRLYSALVHHAPRDGFPASARGWLEIVVEGVRLFRIADWLEPALLDEALSVAVAHGDLALQAVLSSARGFAATRTGHPEEASAWFGRALEAAGALSDRSVAFEVHVQIALGQYLHGQPHEAIATFERLLGDTPEDLVPLPAGLAHPRNTIPESPLAVLAAIYAQVGQYGRALDMLERLRAAGKRLERAELVATANTFLALLHAVRREVEAARSSGEQAVAHWTDSGAEPFFLWLASGALAWALLTSARLDEARDVLAAGQRARVASGLMFFPGSHVFEVLDALEVEGAAPPEGLAMDAEIARMMEGPNGYMGAIARRFRARRLAHGELDGAVAAEIDALHREGISLLRSSRAAPVELARALEEAGRWAERRARGDEATRLVAEAREVFASLGLGAETPPPGTPRVAAALVELGRLGTLANRTDGMWGEMASRLCAVLGAERCALVEVGRERPRALASRGGGPSWIAAVEALAGRDVRAPEVVPAPAVEGEPAAAGQLAIVPFASERLGQRGYAFLENRHSRPVVSPTEAGVLEVVQAQLGVVLENVALWRELETARQRLELENRYYREDSQPAPRRSRIIGDSPALRQVLGLVSRVAPTTTAVLVHGETGVGKELVARELHRLSPRRDRPLIAVHIASLAPALVASGLFGHERGAFTGATEQTKGRFELADGGTLFLDEIGELGPEDQVRLLRVLQEGTFERVGGTRQLRSDFRLVCATNRDLPAEVKAGRFREDLYFRLAAFPIRVPPLRERTEEIPTLALYFMETVGRKFALRFEGIGEADMKRLAEYPWPGNVRELEHVIERAALLSEPPRLRIPPLHEPFLGGATASSATEWIPLEEAERRYLRQVISHTHGRITGPGGAAEILGMKASTLTWRIGKLGLKEDLRRARASRP